MRYLCLALLACCACAAQSISVGAIGGGRVTDDVFSYTGKLTELPQSRFYDVGAQVEIGLTRRFAIEVDALYHRLDFFLSFGQITSYETDSERYNSWEFPVLLKYKLRLSALNPFVEAGVAPRTLSGRDVNTSQSTFMGPGPPSTVISPVRQSPGVGFIAGGGVQFNLGHLSLAPQARYTRWATAQFSGATQNQVDLLVAISWKLR
jgi:hypothetical protein